MQFYCINEMCRKVIEFNFNKICLCTQGTCLISQIYLEGSGHFLLPLPENPNNRDCCVWKSEQVVISSLTTMSLPTFVTIFFNVGAPCRVHLVDHLLWPIFQLHQLHITFTIICKLLQNCGQPSCTASTPVFLTCEYSHLILIIQRFMMKIIVVRTCLKTSMRSYLIEILFLNMILNLLF